MRSEINDKNSIGVIIPTYEREELTKRAVDSAIQAFKFAESNDLLGWWEIIIVDDGSRKPISYQDISLYSNIRIIHLAINRGPAYARNVGIKLCNADYICFLDSDDVWLKTKVYDQLLFINTLQHKTTQLYAISSAVYMKSKKNDEFFYYLPSEAQSLEKFISGCWFNPGSTLLIPKKTFEKIGYYHEKLKRLEDYEFFLRFAYNGGKLFVVNNPGALIEPSGSASTNDVFNACKLINSSVNSLGLSSLNKQKLIAYLSLEKSASLRSSNLFSAVYWFIISWIKYPRFTINIEYLSRKSKLKCLN